MIVGLELARSWAGFQRTVVPIRQRKDGPRSERSKRDCFRSLDGDHRVGAVERRFFPPGDV